MTTSAPYTQNKNKFADVATEWGVLGALISNENVEWINRLSPALFTGNRANVLNSMRDAYSEYGNVSFEALNQYLQGEVPGELFTARTSNITAGVVELARLAKKRQAKQLAAKLTELADEFDPSIDAIHTALNFEPILADEDGSLTPGAQALLADLHNKRSGVYQFARTGFTFMDTSFGGEWKPKALIVYAGGPGTGKTTLVAQSMLKMSEGYVIEKTGEHIITPSLFFSLEMAKEDLMLKWLGSTLEIDTSRIQSGNLTPEEYEAVERQTVYIQKLPMYVIDKGNITLSHMLYEIRKYVRAKKVRVVFIDYLQIVNHHPTGNDNNDLGDFSEKLKQIAKELNITVVLLSQITPGKDGVFKIRDSGEVGANADAVIQGILDSDEPGALKNVSIDRMKNRFGPTGKTGILFNSPLQRFEEE